MAEEILNEVHMSNMFDLRGVVAVVTGGGTVSILPWTVSPLLTSKLVYQ